MALPLDPLDPWMEDPSPMNYRGLRSLYGFFEKH